MSSQADVHPYKPAILSDKNGDLSKIWTVNYYVWSERKSELVRKRVTFNHATAAERYFNAGNYIEAINEALKDGLIVDPVVTEISNTDLTPKTSIQDAFNKFLEIRGKSIDPNTLKGYKKDINIFLEWAKKTTISETNSKLISEMPINTFTSNEVFRFSDYIDGKVTNKLDKDGNVISSKTGVAKKTYSNYIATLRTAFTFLINRKVLKENPFLDVKKRKGGSSQHVPYSPKQVREFKRICLEVLGDEQLWLFINFIYYGFFRPREEGQYLQVKHILKRTIIVPGDIAKNDNSEHVRIPKGLQELIEKHKIRNYPPNYYVFSQEKRPGAKNVGINYFYKRNRKVLNLAKLTDQEYDLYGWKHTGVIALYQKTKDMKLIQIQCRHKDINTTDKYLRELGLFMDDNALDIFPEAGADH